MPDLTYRIERIASQFIDEKGVVGIYLFGSYARQRPFPLSDVDIAILLDEDLTQEDWGEKYNYYYHRLCSELKTNAVDVIILNEVPHSFAYTIIKEGRILYVRDEDKLSSFIERTVQNYLENSFIREEGYFHLKERLENKKFA